MAFTQRVTPRYLEVDQLGVVFNMWYLAYFDDALTGFLTQLGFPYPQLRAAGLDVMLVHTELDWHQGLRFGELADVAVTCERVGTSSFTLRFEARRVDGASPDGASPGEQLCLGRTVYVLVGTDGTGKRTLPDDLRAALATAAPS
jgi:acyl-CoA thioester hydrolase